MSCFHIFFYDLHCFLYISCEATTNITSWEKKAENKMVDQTDGKSKQTRNEKHTDLVRLLKTD
jgi:hypothetical protein